jgi:predicted secreted hydrolase
MMNEQSVLAPLTRGYLTLQHQVRGLASLIPHQEVAPLFPASPTGPEIERFHDPALALCSWSSKQTQWWYFTGHLVATTGRGFGFELVFFQRRTQRDYLGILPLWAVRPELGIAHFALTEAENPDPEARFRYWQKGGLLGGLPGYFSPERFFVEVGGWSAKQTRGGRIHLVAASEGCSLDLTLAVAKPLCYHGRAGYSQKYDDPSVSSFYCSYPRLLVEGDLLLDGLAHEVTGLAWMDHEKMTCRNDVLNTGWDWCSLQLESGEDLMFYFIRKLDGSYAPHSSGTWIDASGNVIPLLHGDLEVEVLEHWVSPTSGGRYPVRRRVRVKPLDLELEVTPLVPSSELDTTRSSFNTYWEGAVVTTGTRAGQRVQGRGFQELVGYDQRARSKLLQILFADPPEKPKKPGP